MAEANSCPHRRSLISRAIRRASHYPHRHHQRRTPTALEQQAPASSTAKIATVPASTEGEPRIEPTLLWIGCSGCSGETQALLGVEGQASDLVDLIDVDGLRLLWHPSLSEHDLWPVFDELMAGRVRLTVLCVEGSIALAEDGMFDIAGDVGKFEIVRSLCDLADYVVAMGACWPRRGWQAQPPNPSGAVGLQHTLDVAGGLLPPQWRSRAGLRSSRWRDARCRPTRRVAALRWALSGAHRWPWAVRHGTDGSAVLARHRVPGLRDTEADRAALHGLHEPEVPQLRASDRALVRVGCVSERVFDSEPSRHGLRLIRCTSPRTGPVTHRQGALIEPGPRPRGDTSQRGRLASTGTSATDGSRRRGARARCTGATR